MQTFLFLFILWEDAIILCLHYIYSTACQNIKYTCDRTFFCLFIADICSNNILGVFYMNLLISWHFTAKKHKKILKSVLWWHIFRRYKVLAFKNWRKYSNWVSMYFLTIITCNCGKKSHLLPPLTAFILKTLYLYRACPKLIMLDWPP